MASVYSVRGRYRDEPLEQLLSLPVTVLLGVSPDSGSLLALVGIETIFDLGASGLFADAEAIERAAMLEAGDPRDHLPSDLVGEDWREKTAKELLDAPPEALRRAPAEVLRKLAQSLDVQTIRDIAQWPPRREAKRIVGDAYGSQTKPQMTDERPDDLIPVARRYATDRVQYDVILMDKVIEAPGSEPDLVSGTHVPAAQGQMAPVMDLAAQGAVDIGEIATSALFARPAYGAVLTYAQSWYPQGLALGHLLHSMALAPGESTRIAMVDWSRQVTGRAQDDTTQTEGLISDLGRQRAISEVTASVAREAQSGFSRSSSQAVQNQYGETAGSAGIGGVSGQQAVNKAVIGGGDGVRVHSEGSSYSTGVTTGEASGWSSSSGERALNAEMTQNIADRTHQASNAVRNRRATSITETSQRESETLSTRIVTNYNHMHALTIEYFETVQIYRVVIELSRVTRCLFVPMKLITFDEAAIRRFRDIIASVGLIPQVRALAVAEPGRVSLTRPLASSPWSSARLARMRMVLGDPIGNMEDRYLFLPIEDMVWKSFGTYDKAVFEAFDAVIVTSRRGERIVLPLVDHAEAHSHWLPRYSVDLATIDFTGIAAIHLRRRADKGDFSGSGDFSLVFDRRLADGTFASNAIDELGLVASGGVSIPKDQPEVLIFEMILSITDKALLQHLEQNALYYSRAIWGSLDAAAITTLLATYTLNRRRLIEVIDPVPVSVSGNYLIFRYYDGETGKDWQAFLKRNRLDSPQPQENLVPLPSGGVFAEAVLGRSNAAEKLDITRFWNWQDSPIPIQPPEINALSAGGKDAPPATQTAPLEGSVVNIVNPPSLPDPAGLAPLYSAIANGNMFRDMSGMAQTAGLLQNAIGAAQAGAAVAAQNATAAQSTAAKQLTDTLQIAAQLVSSLFGRGGSIGVSSSGAASPTTDGISDRLPINPSNAGLLRNLGADMDQRGIPPVVTGGSGGSDPSEWASWPGTAPPEPGPSAPPLVSAPSNESQIIHGKPRIAPRSPTLASTTRRLVTLSSDVNGTDGTSSPLNGRLEINFDLPAEETTASNVFEERTYRQLPLQISAGRGSAVIELPAGPYVLRPIYAPTSDLDLAVLHSLGLGMSSTDIIDLIGLVSNKIMSHDVNTLRRGDDIVVKPDQRDIRLQFVATVRSLPNMQMTLKLDSNLGFTTGVDGKLKFDSSKLGTFAGSLAGIILDAKKAAGVGALLSAFSIQGEFTGGASSGTAGSGSVELKIIPGVLTDATLKEI